MSIILSKYELDKIKESKPIGKGSYANLYKYDDKLIKLFKAPLDSSEKRLIKNLIGEKIDYFVFPDELVRDVFRFLIGYTEEKIDGITLQNLIILLYQNKHKDIGINEFVLLYEKLKPSIKEMSKNKLNMFDIHDENIMYNGNLNFIDIDLYYYTKASFASSIYKSNMNNVGLSLVESIYNLNGDLTSSIEAMIKKSRYDEDYFERFIDCLDKNYSGVDTLIKYRNMQIK